MDQNLNHSYAMKLMEDVKFRVMSSNYEKSVDLVYVLVKSVYFRKNFSFFLTFMHIPSYFEHDLLCMSIDIGFQIKFCTFNPFQSEKKIFHRQRGKRKTLVRRMQKMQRNKKLYRSTTLWWQSGPQKVLFPSRIIQQDTEKDWISLCKEYRSRQNLQKR